MNDDQERETRGGEKGCGRQDSRMNDDQERERETKGGGIPVVQRRGCERQSVGEEDGWRGG
jgi:hypothetical protein